MATEKPRMPGPFSGLSIKLIVTIVAVILVVEVIVYLPSAADFRNRWLNDRLGVGVVAARVLDTVPDVMDLPQSLTDRLLSSAGATAIVYRREGQSQLLAVEGDAMPREAVTIDMRRRDPPSLIAGVVDTLLGSGTRTLRIIGQPGDEPPAMVEVLIPEAPLRADLLVYSRNFFIISFIVAVMTALVLYLIASVILIAPIRRLTGNVMMFRRAPENASLIVSPSGGRDEIGILETELAGMQRDIFTLLRQRRHLADLGLAVAKINHDLRNTLTSAQLLSDQVANLDDPKVQRLAPRLVNSIDRAIGFAQSVLDYGRQSATPPRPVEVEVKALIEEAALDAGLVGHPAVRLVNAVPVETHLKVDPSQMGRVLVNLLKNAREALEASRPAPLEPGGNGNGHSGEAAAERPEARIEVSFAGGPDTATLSISDNGPGLPPRARENLFVAFEGSARAGGTGLGLAIARELTEAHGGRLVFVDQPVGTRFDIVLPASARLV